MVISDLTPMQSLLMIHDQPPIPPVICDALAQCYEVRSTPDSTQARELAKPGQVIVLALTDIHAFARVCLLRELLVLDYKVVVLHAGRNAALMRACAALGAHGMADMDGELAVLLFNIKTVCNGQRTYPPACLSVSLAFYVEHLPPLPRSSMAVLNTILHHPQMSNEEIGNAVQLTVGRVKNIFTSLYKKFAVRNRHDLANAAIRQGYFAGLDLIFPRGLNVSARQIKMVNGERKYEIAL